MPAELHPEQDDYVSEDDSDFTPDGAPVEEAASSASEDEDAPTKSSPAAAKRKRHDDGGGEADGFENSGDEAITGRGRKRHRKSGHANQGDASSGVAEGDTANDDGEGIAVKTRSMRAAEKAERRPAAAKGPVTVDVDALWARMTSGASAMLPRDTRRDAAPPPLPPGGSQHSRDGAAKTSLHKADATATATAKAKADAPGMMRIKRTYNFAGQVHTEEKLVARDSAEAKLYLATLGAKDGGPSASGHDGAEEVERPERLPRKAFRSAFEPAMDGSIGDDLLQQPQQTRQGLSRSRTDLNLALSARLQAREASRKEFQKLNTVEKSRMDWAGFVDREGIKDELELAGKSKGSYTARQDFLARSEARREDDARRARMVGRAA